MNVENINFTQFLDYFTSWYPILVPTTIFGFVLLGCLVDWFRVILIRYVDDNESDVEYWFWNKIRFIFIPNIIYDSKYLDDRKYYWVKNNDFLGNKWVGFEDKEAAKKYMKTGDGQPNISANCMSSEFDFKATLIPRIMLFPLSLLAFKILPLIISVGVLLAYGLLRTTRSVVRLAKKFKAHIKDPNAHKGDE